MKAQKSNFSRIAKYKIEFCWLSLSPFFQFTYSLAHSASISATATALGNRNATMNKTCKETCFMEHTDS